MAKYEEKISGSFDDLKVYIKEKLPKGSATFSWEEEFEGESNGCKYWVVACERFAYLGKNRNSLNITLIEEDDSIHLMATSTGGSQGMFFKFNKISDNNFLGELIGVIRHYKDEEM